MWYLPSQSLASMFCLHSSFHRIQAAHTVIQVVAPITLTQDPIAPTAWLMECVRAIAGVPVQADAKELAQQCILNWVGVALAGAFEPLVGLLLAQAAEDGPVAVRALRVTDSASPPAATRERPRAICLGRATDCAGNSWPWPSHVWEIPWRYRSRAIGALENWRTSVR